MAWACNHWGRLSASRARTGTTWEEEHDEEPEAGGRRARDRCSRDRRCRLRRRRGQQQRDDRRQHHDRERGRFERPRRPAGPDDDLGCRAAVARPGPRDRHDLVERPAEHHGSAGHAGAEPRAAAEHRGELGRQRQGRHLPPAHGRQVDERRPRDRAGLRVVLEAHDLAGAGRGLRVPVLRDPGRPGVQLLRPEEAGLQRPARQGRDHRDRRPHAQGDADEPAAVVRAAGRAHVVPGGQQEGRRQVGRQVDGAGAHHHERRLQARRVAARLRARPGQVGRLAQRVRRDAHARQRQDHHRRHHRRAGVRGR